VASGLSSSSLCFFLLLLWHGFDILRFKFAESLLFLALEKSLVPYNDRVELFASDKHIIELLKCFMLLIHHAEYPQTVTLHLLNEVTIQIQGL
jgi:hypothetical protein